MTAQSFFIASCLALFLAAGCRSSRADKDNSPVQGPVWQRQPILIDGSDADWIKPLPFYDKKEGLHYSISNDKDDLYILISARSQEEQQKIIEGGLTVWVNNQAEKANSEAVGIGYPTGRKQSRESSIMAEARPDQYQPKKHSLEDDLSAYTLYGFNKDTTVQNFDAGESNSAGIQVKIGFNSINELIYEARIPLTSIYPQNSSHNFTGKSFAVGIFIEGLPPEEGGRRRGGGGGVSFGGGLGMGSFGSGGGLGMSIGSGAFGGGRGGRNGDSHLYDQTQLWQVVNVARPGPAH
jgi:hypothetical protein